MSRVQGNVGRTARPAPSPPRHTHRSHVLVVVQLTVIQYSGIIVRPQRPLATTSSSRVVCLSFVKDHGYYVVSTFYKIINFDEIPSSLLSLPELQSKKRNLQ